MEITEITRDILEILRKVDEKEWMTVFSNFLIEIDTKDFRISKRRILKIYGGMGSFNDLVLYKNGQICSDENINLDELRKKLYIELIKS